MIPIFFSVLSTLAMYLLYYNIYFLSIVFVLQYFTYTNGNRAAHNSDTTPTIAVTTRAGRMGILSMSIEVLKSFLDVGTVVLLFLAFAFGAGVLITGNVINERQAEQLKTFDKELTDAKTELGKQQERAAQLEKGNIEAQRSLESERLTRLEMEESLAPRMLVSSNDAIRRLQRSGSTKYLLEFVSDAEAERIATQIAWVLTLSDWVKLSSGSTSIAPIRDGIAVEAKLVNGKTPIPASELAEYLRANGLHVWTGSLKEPFRLDEIPDGAVRIRIGLKPNLYFEKKFADGTLATMKLLDALKTPGLERKELTKKEVERLRSEWKLPAQ